MSHVRRPDDYSLVRRNNQIGDLGAKALAVALAKSSVTSVNLGCVILPSSSRSNFLSKAAQTSAREIRERGRRLRACLVTILSSAGAIELVTWAPRRWRSRFPNPPSHRSTSGTHIPSGPYSRKQPKHPRVRHSRERRVVRASSRRFSRPQEQPSQRPGRQDTGGRAPRLVFHLGRSPAREFFLPGPTLSRKEPKYLRATSRARVCVATVILASAGVTKSEIWVPSQWRSRFPNRPSPRSTSRARIPSSGSTLQISANIRARD